MNFAMTQNSWNFPDLPQYPNVDPFNYESMKKMLVEKLDSFTSAPFTIQRISELLSEPRKQYSRVDKFMRAVEKTILVVSTIPPGRTRTESSDSLDSGMNGDFSDVNVDIDMDGQETHQNSNHKENNHSVKNDSEEKEEQKDDAVKGTTKVTVDNVSVSITVIEPERTKIDETVKESSAATTSEEIKSDEPIRSAENEILVETAEVISETPPLAALENIVATTDPSLSTENIIIAQTETKLIEFDDTPKETQEEIAEIEAKRIKLSDETSVEVTAEVVTEVVESEKVIENDEKVVEDTKVEETTSEQIEESVTSTPPITVDAVVPEIEVPKVAEIPSEAQAEQKIDEPTIETPVEITPAVAEAAPVLEITTQMEEVPIPTIENKMDDEDPPTAATTVEQEMTPITSKMDTDETLTVEAAPMEFEDDGEPMDQ